MGEGTHSRCFLKLDGRVEDDTLELLHAAKGPAMDTVLASAACLSASVSSMRFCMASSGEVFQPFSRYQRRRILSAFFVSWVSSNVGVADL